MKFTLLHIKCIVTLRTEMFENGLAAVGEDAFGVESEEEVEAEEEETDFFSVVRHTSFWEGTAASEGLTRSLSMRSFTRSTTLSLISILRTRRGPRELKGKIRCSTGENYYPRMSLSGNAGDRPTRRPPKPHPTSAIRTRSSISPDSAST